MFHYKSALMKLTVERFRVLAFTNDTFVYLVLQCTQLFHSTISSYISTTPVICCLSDGSHTPIKYIESTNPSLTVWSYDKTKVSKVKIRLSMDMRMNAHFIFARSSKVRRNFICIAHNFNQKKRNQLRQISIRIHEWIERNIWRSLKF